MELSATSPVPPQVRWVSWLTPQSLPTSSGALSTALLRRWTNGYERSGAHWTTSHNPSGGTLRWEGCACTDADCAKAVDKKEQNWRMENYKGLPNGDKGSMKNAHQEFTKCRDAHVK